MVFTGRSNLLAFSDQLIAERGGAQVDRDALRPVLVIEGYGGSGRTAVLSEIGRRWHKRTMTAEIRSLALPPADPEKGERPLIAAILLGLALGTRAPGFERVSFDRVVLACIAMAEPVPAGDPRRAAEEMLGRLTRYRDRGAVQALISSLVRGVKESLTASTLLAGVPIAKQTADAVADTAARGITDALQRSAWVAKHNWGDALTWFGHQDLGLANDPIATLVRLSWQTALDGPGVGKDIDDVLVAALLADLRAGLGKIANRRANAVLLIDDGDAPAATTFVTSLVRVRQFLADRQVPPDPLAVIVASGGGLATAVRDHAPEPHRVAESGLGTLTAAQVGESTWLPVLLDDLSRTDVESIVDGYLWPPELGTYVIADSVHRLTTGHPAATTLIVHDLFRRPTLTGRIDPVLDNRAPDGNGRTIGEYLRDRAVAALSVHGRADARANADLATLAAARDRDEAEALLGLLRTPETGAQALACPALWPATGPRCSPAMPSFLRFLLLQQLAGRAPDAADGWPAVFTALLEQADGDERPHHLLALDRGPEAVETLTKQLSTRPGAEWLALLDATLATPAVHREPADADAAVADDAANRVGLLVGHLHPLADPRLTEVAARVYHHLGAAHQYMELATTGTSDRRKFLQRGQEHRRRAERLS
jgi:hypothetical protein